MVEVFKTDVADCEVAERIIKSIQERYTAYKVNFDLEDCDRILRIETPTEFVNSFGVVDILADHGFEAVILEDVVNEYHLSGTVILEL